MNQISASVCEFKRSTENSRIEKGIMINEDMLLIDMRGKIVPYPVYSYQVFQHHGCLVVKED